MPIGTSIGPTQVFSPLGFKKCNRTKELIITLVCKVYLTKIIYVATSRECKSHLMLSMTSFLKHGSCHTNKVILRTNSQKRKQKHSL